MRPGESRTVPVSYPVAESTPTGAYVFHVRVSLGGEALSVSREVYVLGGK